jgi:DNA sulfur modification protein DndD
VILKEVVLHNFGSFRGRVAIDLSPTAAGGERPVILIGALNGSGKTTLLDGVLLALYGGRARCSTRKTLSYPDFLRQCTNSRTPPAEGALVSVCFDYVSTRMRAELRVTRSWKVVGQRTVELLEVQRNGRPDPELSETWPETVENLIPLGISNLFFFDGEQVREIASNAEPSEEVKGAIRTLLGIDLPDQLMQDLEVISSRRRRSQVKDSRTREKLQALEDAVREAVRARSEHATHLGVLRNQLGAAQRELARTTEEFTAVGGGTAQQRAQTQSRLDSCRKLADAGRERLREVVAGSLPVGLILPLLGRALDRARAETTSLETGATANLLKRRDDEVLAGFKKVWGDPEAHDALRAVLKADRVRRGDRSAVRVVMWATAEDVALASRVVGEARTTSAASARGVLREIESHEAAARRLESQLSKAAPDELLNLGLKGLAEAQARVAAVSAEIEATQARHLDAQRLAEQLDKEFKRMRAESSVDSALYDEDARVIRAADRASVVMSEFRKRLLIRRVHELERHIGERFTHLARKEGMVNRVLIDPVSFRLSLFADDGTPVNRERMSSGEQQLLAVAFLWGLSLASGRTLPVLIDTPLGRMDHTHRRNLVERYFPQASHQVILLSTDAEVDQTYQQMLHGLCAVDREYLLSFDQTARETHIADGYFWSA